MEKRFLLKINGVGRAAVITVSLLTTLFVAAPRVSGDERTLSLKEAVAIALKDNHELKAFGYALSAEGENVGIARSALLTWLHKHVVAHLRSTGRHQSHYLRSHRVLSNDKHSV